MKKIDIYKKNKKRARVLKILAPIVFWSFLLISFICLNFAVKNSFGNLIEMIDLLDKKTYTGEELQANYQMLINQYGEWIIGNGSNGFTISFINIKSVMFSGFMLTNAILSVIFFISAYLLGKWLLPLFANQITQNNQDIVNETILQDKE